MCVNDIVMHIPLKVSHAYSNDVLRLPWWVKARRPRYRSRFQEQIITHSCNSGVQYRWPFPGHGTSALNACYIGIAMGYERIVLIGIPLDNTGHYFEPPWEESNFLREVPEDGSFHFWRLAAKKIFCGRVKSMSGRTRELLGEP